MSWRHLVVLRGLQLDARQCPPGIRRGFPSQPVQEQSVCAAQIPKPRTPLFQDPETQFYFSNLICVVACVCVYVSVFMRVCTCMYSQHTHRDIEPVVLT